MQWGLTFFDGSIEFAMNPDLRIFNQIFSDTTNSYKFLWFLAILDQLRDNPDVRTMSFEDLTVRMVNRAWYPMNTFRLSFGSQDSIRNVVLRLSLTMVDYSVPPRSWNTEERASINKTLSRWVPYRFIRPFFESQTRGLPDHKVNSIIQRLSQSIGSTAPYEVHSDHIILKEGWLDLIQSQFTVFADFTEHRLCHFLQKHNPNVPGIINKLHKPEISNLTKQRKLWLEVFRRHRDLTCIYTDQVPRHIAIDHFLPWTFTTHDLCWNLVGCDPISNIRKSNSLPSLNRYMNPFLERQHVFFKDVFASKPSDKLLEDYVTLFKTSGSDIASMEPTRFGDILSETIRTQHQIAKNMGFREGWG